MSTFDPAINRASETIRPLRGAPLSILAAFMMLPQPLTLRDLWYVTSYSQHTLEIALRRLCDRGYVYHVSGEGIEAVWAAASTLAGEPQS